MYVRHLGLYCVLFRRVLIYKTDVALQLTKLRLKKLLLLLLHTSEANHLQSSCRPSTSDKLSLQYAIANLSMQDNCAD